MQNKKIEPKLKSKAEKNLSAFFISSAGVSVSQARNKSVTAHPAEDFFLEQTMIAKKLGISNNALKWIVKTTELKFRLIENKRHYDWQLVLNAIKK